MNGHDLLEYLTHAQSTINGLKLMLVSDDITKVLGKLDNMFMVFVLHSLPKEYSSVKDQALTNTTIPMVEELIDRLVRVSLPSDDTLIAPESSAFVSNFSSGGRSGHSRGRGCGRGGRGNFYYTHCKKDGHTQDRCFNLHGFPNKTSNVAQTSTNLESKGELETTFYADEYKEYLKLKVAQYVTSSTIIAHTRNSTVCLSHSTPTGWVTDSGASDHVTKLFSKLSPLKYPHYVAITDGSKVEASSVGQVSPIPSLFELCFIDY
ncbi:uncharacterized protein LOC127101108 [Lathyrus oleraceus]|uniref:uncharacterized protein LOC127101108 n=1 Tax=Pisum sativum TaxID=3888 RepID=UPI0021CF18BA|nr:uncharacterized protein LOC127101108 [Pisum sativum]XP_050894399.1 uncharacterized protein LOC127101108 [Pisum sativum]